MSSTFKYHSQVNEVVPWQATYTFPTQATKVNKQTVKLVPKNGSTFTAGQIIRIEFPADNYLNALNSVLQFDLTMKTTPIFVSASVTSQATASTSTYIKLTNAEMGSAQSGTYPAASDSNLGCPIGITQGGVTYWSVIQQHKLTATTQEWWISPPLPIVPAAGTTNYYVSVYPAVAFQRGGAQNVIKRLRVLYGSLVLEDIYEYKTLVRILFEAGVSEDYSSTHGQIVDGMYSSHVRGIWQRGQTANAVSTGLEQTTSNPNYYVVPGPQTGVLQLVPPVPSNAAPFTSTWGTTDKSTYYAGTTTYCLNLLSGLLTQKKLLPLKWMAAQFALEITLASEQDSMTAFSATTSTNYQLTNVNFIAEMLEFDSAYDTAFYDGLKMGGVPIKFSSFHYHSFNLSGQTNVVQIHERARSTKFGLAVARDTTAPSIVNDTDRFFHDLGATFNSSNNGSITNPGKAQVVSYQWRIGGRYYPAQPVRCVYGGAEAFIELQKVLDNLGDYTRGSQITTASWTVGNAGVGAAFIMAAPFENIDIFPDTISGINAEEQSDIALTIVTEDTILNKKLDVFMGYDSLMIVKDGNVVDLVL